jgi:prepilin-type processing-associated H-X9-DG protein
MEFNHPYYDVQHSDGANLLFCDGHAKWQKKTAIRFVQFGADAPATAAFNADGKNGGKYKARF